MKNRSNIILLTVDSLRADRLGCYGLTAGPSLTPHIDRLARESVVFTSAYAQGPSTAFSLPALFTGKYPCRLAPMTWALRFEEPDGFLVTGTCTFVESLQASGYHTAAFHSNPLVSRLFGFEKGFDVFFDDTLITNDKIPSRLRLNLVRLQRVTRPRPHLDAATLNKKVLAWMQTAPQPFFLWVHYMDVHGPYSTKSKIGRWLRAQQRLWRRAVNPAETLTLAEGQELHRNYCRQISALDAELGRFFQMLAERKILDDALVILSADHGEEFCEHGGYTHLQKLYDELLHVPLIARLPGTQCGTFDGLTALIQVASTILEFAEVAHSESCDTQSFLPALLGRSYAPHPYILAEGGSHRHEVAAIRTPDWKLIWKNDGAEKELYDLRRDPSEKINCCASRPDIVQQLELQLLAHREDKPLVHAAPAASPPEMTKEQEEVIARRLEDLGYL